MQQPEPNPPTQPISDLIVDPNFPESAMGKTVDIGGYTGVIVGIVKNSLKLHSSEGTTMSYNINTLRKLYGPHIPPPAPASDQPPSNTPTPAPAAKPDIIENPNFDQPLKPIATFVNRPDFPKCVWGEFLDLRNYTGVVVQIVERSLKVRSREGITRSYNADSLRKLYSNQPAPKNSAPAESAE